MKHVVKRKGHKEEFDERKIYASIYTACLSVRTPQGEAELVAEKVVDQVKQQIHDKPSVEGHEIRTIAHDYLTTLNPDAAYMYKHHDGLHI